MCDSSFPDDFGSVSMHGKWGTILESPFRTLAKMGGPKEARKRKIYGGLFLSCSVDGLWEPCRQIVASESPINQFLLLENPSKSPNLQHFL